MMQITGILLAAGQSRRFGSNKLLHPLKDGIPLLMYAARTMQAVLPHTLVVANAQDDETLELLNSEGMNIVLNHSAQSGMGMSIACGVSASRNAEGWVIALADMPYIRSHTMRSVASGIRSPNSICAPLYNGQRGHPVGFGSAYASALMKLSTDKGARQIIAAHRGNLELFETQDSGVVTDIDCRDDLEQVSVRGNRGRKQTPFG